MDAPMNEGGGPSHVDEGVAVNTRDDDYVQIDETDVEGRDIPSQIGQALGNFAPHFTRQIQSTMEEAMNNEIARRIREEVTTVVRDVVVNLVKTEVTSIVQGEFDKRMPQLQVNKDNVPPNDNQGVIVPGKEVAKGSEIAMAQLEGGSSKRKVEQSYSPNKKFKGSVHPSGNSGRGNFPQCRKCGRNHSGECKSGSLPRSCFTHAKAGHISKDCRSTPKKSLICINCHQEGHRKSACRKLSKAERKEELRKETERRLEKIMGNKKARSFQMTTQEAKESLDVVSDLWRTSDQIAKGLEFEKKAEKKLSGWNIFGYNFISSKHEDAGKLYEKAATCYKLAKSWDQAGAVYVKSAECHLKERESKHPFLGELITFSSYAAANAYADAGRAYKKTNTKECIACLEEVLNLFIEIGRLRMSAEYCKEIAELYEQEQNLEQAISYYEKAADLFQGEEVTTSANQCKQKIAQVSAQLEQYQKAIEIYEEIARQSLNDDWLKYEVRGHLLNAGICQLCKGDVVAIINALERYQDLDPTFSGTREYRLLAGLAAALDEEDVVKFTDVVREFDSMTKLFDSMTKLDEWKAALLLRVLLLLKAKEEEDDDLT